MDNYPQYLTKVYGEALIKQIWNKLWGNIECGFCILTKNFARMISCREIYIVR